MERKSGRGPEDWSDLKAVAAATQEPDPARRWQRLERLLDMERVLSFMALEVMACHIDGYCLSVANYRIYHDLDRDKVLLFPHGMDQMLGGDFAGHVLHQMPIEPNMRGAIAQAILRTPEGLRRYRERCGRLLSDVFRVGALTGRLDEVAARLRPVLLAEGAKAAASFDAAVALKRDQIIRRAASLAGQIQGSRSPRFEDGTARLTVWTTWDDRRDAQLEEGADGGKRTLNISAQRVVSASWRARVMLAAGRYRFEGLARTAGVSAAPGKGDQGAGLRVSGLSAPASRRVASDGPWQKLGCEFHVTSPSAEVDLICELRADRGGAAFDRDSLRLVRLEPSGAGEF